MIVGLASYLTANPILTAFLICHFLSDFQFQSQKVADRKNTEITYLLYHLAGVAVPLCILSLMAPGVWLLALLIFISHAIIDNFKPNITKLFRLTPLIAFLIDQVLHLTIILFLAQFTSGITFLDWIPSELLNGCLFIILVTKPTNIAFKLFFQKYQPEDNQKMDTISGAGATIGLLERIIMGICIYFGQFSSIGLVFTAKSIARYNKISESPAFAEYYLIGSLFSILSVLISAWICLV